jgi:hypothetical protein
MIIDLQPHLAQRAAEESEITDRMDRASKIFQATCPVISQLRELGADTWEIARLFRVFAEWLEEEALKEDAMNDGLR